MKQWLDRVEDLWCEAMHSEVMGRSTANIGAALACEPIPCHSKPKRLVRFLRSRLCARPAARSDRSYKLFEPRPGWIPRC